MNRENNHRRTLSCRGGGCDVAECGPFRASLCSWSIGVVTAPAGAPPAAADRY